MSDIRQLRPARPDIDDDSSGYMPKLPWRWIVGLGLFFVLSFAAYELREASERAELRSALFDAYRGKLGPLVARYETVTNKIYGFTISAVERGVPESYADPRLKLDALHKGKGLYLRLKAGDATSRERIRNASLDMLPDAIGKCLGLAPASAAELFARGSFLDKKWFEQADSADKMKLRVIAEEIRQRSTRDLPFVGEALGAQWFMLVLEHGDNRRDAPVDAYLWDLRTDKLLLSARTKAEGALVAARIVVSGVKPGNYATGAQTGAAQDCSIASQLRAVAGAELTTFTADPPAPQAAVAGAAPTTNVAAPGAAPQAAPQPAAPKAN